MSQLTEDIMKQKSNYLRVKKFIDLGLNPHYGLSAELTILMYELYEISSGDTTYSGRYGCGACQMSVYQRLQDFLNYGDNLGKPLIDWKK